MAALARRVPSVIHEANAVAGRANRFLAPKVTAVATSFETTGLLGAATAKAVMTGNPVRPQVVAAASAYRTPDTDGPLRLLVFGGSQGARVFADLARRRLPRCRPTSGAGFPWCSRAAGGCGPRPRRLCDGRLWRRGEALLRRPAGADRRGASGPVPVRRLVGQRTGGDRPALDPGAAAACPGQRPEDQRARAGARRRGDHGRAGVADAGTAGRSPRRIDGRSDRLATMAEAARSQGRPDAVARLADLVLAVADGLTPTRTQGHDQR